MQENKTIKTKRSRALALFLTLALIAGTMSGCGGTGSTQDPELSEVPTESEAAAEAEAAAESEVGKADEPPEAEPNPAATEKPKKKSGIRRLAESTKIVKAALTVKDDYTELMQNLKEQDLEAARARREQIDTDIQALEGNFDGVLWRTAEGIPALADDINSARELIDIVKTANTELLDPLLDQMESHPLSGMNTEQGLDMRPVFTYLDFAEAILPAAEEIVGRLAAVDKDFLNMVDGSGKIADYSTRLAEMMANYKPYLEYLPMLRNALGENGDRLYVFAAQNTAEIRASGGFPGAVGAIRIRDGYLSLMDFLSVYDVFESSVAREARSNYVEAILFGGRMSLTWDADFSPDFERVGHIWALAYQQRSGEKVDGVLSATPVVIQRLLAFLGEITLSDGTVLNGENAMRVLQHDLYFKYMCKHPPVPTWEANDLTDQLFAETAKKTMELMIATLSPGQIGSYLNFAKESFADRTLLLWMTDEDEQNLIRGLGWSGCLNQNEQEPALGVFFNSTTASKMGWFLDIDVSIGDGTENEDGSMTYPVTVSFSNKITPEERDDAGGFILGGDYGSLAGGLYIFAPAGGTISSGTTSYGILSSARYRDLDLIYEYSAIATQSSLVVECEVTTAPGVHAPLTVMHTPTGQDYREAAAPEEGAA